MKKTIYSFRSISTLLSLFFSLFIVSKSQGQNTDLPNPTPNIITAPAGTLVIAMDNTLQANPGYFNVKAYGLAVKLLNNQNALHWVIKSGKAKDAIDFSASATRVFPTAAAAAVRDFKAGPLLILPRDSTGVTAIINAFNNAQSASARVNIYQLTAPAQVDVRYILTQKPRGVVLNDGNNEKIHAEYYQLASIDSPVNWRVTDAVHLIDQCYTFASEPHSSVVGPTIDSIKSYVMRGGNFLAQCLAINTYENASNGHFQTTNGITILNTSTAPNFRYPNADLSFSQYEGKFDPNLIGGAEKNWVLAAGSSYHNDAHKHQAGASPSDTNLVGQSVSKLAPGRGHLAFFSGGHDYTKNNTIDFVNGLRSFFNAFLTPSGLTQCDFLRFDYDLSISKTATPTTLCAGATTTFRVVVRNEGPTQTGSGVIIVKDVFPSGGFSIVSATANKGNFVQATGLWTVGTMAAGESDTLTIVATATAGGSYTNTAYVQLSQYDYVQANDTARVVMTVNPTSSVTRPPVTGCGSYTLPWGQTVTTGGSYSHTYTSVNGCDSVVTIPVTINNVSIAPSSTAVLCNGGSSGSASAVPSGGTAPYTYLWNNGATTSSISNVAAGTYSVTITDAAGCTANTSVTVTQPPALVASSNSSAILCFGGSSTVTVTGSGGTGPYTGTGSFTRTAGTYSFVVTDAKGCTASTTITITQPSQLTTSSTATPILFYGGTSTVTVSGNGGTAPYSGTGNFTRTAGTYSFTVTDANGCTAITTVTITQPDTLIATATAPAILCNGGSTTVTVSATGGVPPYSGTGTFIRPAGTYTFTVTDANGITASKTITITQPTALVASSTATPILCNGGSSTVTVSATGGTAPYNGTGTFTRTAGTYNFTVTDANGCTAQTSVTITQPSALGATTSGTAASCNGTSTGSASVSPSGGTAPYTYLWSNGATTVTAGNLAAGTYTVTVTDANGCTFVTNRTVTQPSGLNASSTSTPILCNGGSTTVTVSASGGTAPYTGTGTYTRPAGTYNFTVSDANGCTAQTGITISQPAVLNATSTSTAILINGGTATITVSASGGTAPYNGTGTFVRTAGTYSFTVTDANGCTAITTITITQPTPLIANSSAPAILCNGGSTTVTVTATGGVSPYTGTGTFTRTAGTYTFTVTDANGATANTTITISQPSALSATASGTAPSCFGNTNGSASVTASGGTPPYTYLWSNGATTATAGNLAAGTYTVTVTDANGCSITRTATVNQPSVVPAPTLNVTQPTCSTSTGTITITAPTGTGFTYNINGGTYQSGTVFSNLTAGTYAVVARNASGCTSAPTNVTILTSAPCDPAGIYPTNTTCSSFKAGTIKLTELCYSVRRGAVSNVTPGVFFYYSTITAPASNFTVDIVQTSNTPGFSLFNIVTSTNVAQVFFYNASCNKVLTGIQVSRGQARVNVVNATPGQQYVISVKYDSKSIIGSVPAFAGQIASYTFETRVNNVPLVGTATNLPAKPSNCVAIRSESPDEKWPKVNAYPNPIIGDLTLDYEMIDMGQVEFSVYDVNGALVMQKQVQHDDAGAYQIRLPFESATLAKGMYFIRILRNSDVETIRIVYSQ